MNLQDYGTPALEPFLFNVRLGHTSLQFFSVYHDWDIPILPPLLHVRVFPRSSPSPVLRINLDLLPKSFSSYLLRPIYGLLPLRSQARTRTLNAVFNSASPCYRIATTKSGEVPNLSPLGYVVERHLFLSYPLRLRYLSIRGLPSPR